MTVTRAMPTSSWVSGDCEFRFCPRQNPWHWNLVTRVNLGWGPERGGTFRDSTLREQLESMASRIRQVEGLAKGLVADFADFRERLEAKEKEANNKRKHDEMAGNAVIEVDDKSPVIDEALAELFGTENVSDSENVHAPENEDDDLPDDGGSQIDSPKHKVTIRMGKGRVS